MSEKTESDWVNLDVAQMLLGKKDKDKKYVRNLIKSKRIEARDTGHGFLVRKTSIFRFIESLPIPGEEKPLPIPPGNNQKYRTFIKPSKFNNTLKK